MVFVYIFGVYDVGVKNVGVMILIIRHHIMFNEIKI